jgi:hypothetical protein
MAWCKAPSAAQRTIYSTTDNTQIKGWTFSIYNNNSLAFYDRGGSVGILSGNNVWTNDAWFHAAITYTNGQQLLYCNGVAVATGTSTRVFTAVNESEFIGSEFVSGGAPYFSYNWNGQLDQVAIINQKVLSASEIQTIIANTHPTNNIRVR